MRRYQEFTGTVPRAATMVSWALLPSRGQHGVSGMAGPVCVWTSGDQLSDGGFSFLVGAASQPPAASSAVRTSLM